MSWERYWDAKQEHFFLFNATTQESKWEEVNPQEGREGRHGWATVNANHTLILSRWQPVPEGDDNARREAEHTAQVAFDALDRAAVSHGINAEETVEDDEAQLLAPTRWQMRYELVKQDTANILQWYNCCFFFHACACEAPLAAVEAIVHGTALLLLAGLTGAATALVYLAEPRRVASRDFGQDEALSAYMLQFVRRWGREGLLFAASAASLLFFPCSACFVYRGFSAEEEDEWNLSPLPTFLGGVDPRRFCTFAFGQGSSAGNVDLPQDLLITRTRTASAVIAGSGAAGVLQFSSSLPQHKYVPFGAPKLGCMDNWAGDVLFPPRRLRSMLPPACLEIFDSILNGHQRVLSDDREDDDGGGTEFLEGGSCATSSSNESVDER
jgi:hypothetical protein